LLSVVVGAELKCEHLLGRAIIGHLRGLGVRPLAVDEVTRLPGMGLTANSQGRRISVGSAVLFSGEAWADVPPPTQTQVFFGWDRTVAGRFLLSDLLRPESQKVIDFFRRRGIDCSILSGARQDVVDHLARVLGLGDARGDCPPEAKRERVEKLQSGDNRVVFVGDGANDGPAMAEAEFSVALRHGSDLSLATADIVPLAGNLAALPKLVMTSEQVRRTIRGNFAWAIGYNALFIPLAMAGFLHPVFAAVLMLTSSTTVLLNSLRIRGWLDRNWSRGNPDEQGLGLLLPERPS
jgi:P-type E1-E2 ATPase